MNQRRHRRVIHPDDLGHIDEFIRRQVSRFFAQRLYFAPSCARGQVSLLTFELGEGSRCCGVDQGEGQVLQGGFEVSVDLQHQAEP